jgi:peptidoglycan/xylan/chitin deacetylase (PgdA/CDA1 family)
MLSRRQLLASGLSAPLAVGTLKLAGTAAEKKQPALVSITLDLEMCRDFPVRGQTRWLYEKGNLDEPTKKYAVEACRRIKERGGVAHCFVVGRVFEQPDVDWLKGIAEGGHPIGNHTYDHVNVHAKKREELQDRFTRAPWLIEGRTVPEVIRENIQLTTVAMRERLGVEPNGFRTPGGFAKGLAGRPDVQNLLLGLGFEWVSSKYAFHAMGDIGQQPDEPLLAKAVEMQPHSQPFRYPTGLIEVPMSPVSDVMAMRIARWSRKSWLRSLRKTINWTIENGAVFDLLAHPAVLVVMDPKFEAIDMVCDMVQKAGDKAKLVGLDAIAKRAK